MRQIYTIVLSILMLNQLNSQDFASYPTYLGKDLGMTYTKAKTTIKVWSPVAESLTLRLYKSGLPSSDPKDLLDTKPMTKSKQGVWSIELLGDQKGKYYTIKQALVERQKRKSPTLTPKLWVPMVYAHK